MMTCGHNGTQPRLLSFAKSHFTRPGASSFHDPAFTSFLVTLNARFSDTSNSTRLRKTSETLHPNIRTSGQSVMGATDTTGHVRKRQYQPSISSYFPADGTRSQPTRSPLSPPLPAETQASLLSVGMRVRKSVPEGYKTHKTIGTDGFPFPSTAPAAPRTQQSPSYASQPTRELTPFCGLHKTGGWASQPQQGYIPASSAPAAVETDSMPSMTMSQQTMPSTQGSFTSLSSSRAGESKKRTFEEEIEEDMDAFFDEVEDEKMGAGRRPIAKPKVGLRRAATDGVLVAGVADGDFDEAAFLAPMDVDDT